MKSIMKMRNKIRIKPEGVSGNEAALLATPVDRLASTIEWFNAKHTIAGDYGIFHICECIATVISKTYVEVGDSAIIPDDVALLLIRELLLALDVDIIERNMSRKVKPRLLPGSAGWMQISRDLRFRRRSSGEET